MSKPPSKKARKLLRIRGIVTTLLILACVLATATGGVLFFVKRGMILGMPRHVLYDIHAVSALVMVAAALVHLYLNRKIYKKELKALRREQKE